MPEMPTLGDSQKPSSNPLPGVVITAVLVGVIAGGVYWWRHRPVEAPAGGPTVEVAVAPAAPGTPAAAPVAAVAPADAPTAAAVSPGGAQVVPAPVLAAAPLPTAAASTGLKSFTVHINGPLESAIIGALGKTVGAPLTQVVNRSLVWWIKVPNDLVKGDTLSVVYEEREHAEPLVHAVRFASGKLGKTLEAVRYKPDGEAFARYYQPDGKELEERLVDGPLDDWEQITSLLKDGRRHQGVDFKTPVGTPVKATFDGTVSRKTWAFRGNGNSLDIAEAGGKGRHALFLHLSEIPKGLEVGQRVKKGQVIAQSGNTGHSFAPHLHYQLLDSSGKVIDPFDSHQTTRRTLDTKQTSALGVEVGRLNKLLENPTVLAGGR